MEIQLEILSYISTEKLRELNLMENTYWQLYRIIWHRRWFMRCLYSGKYTRQNIPRAPPVPKFDPIINWGVKLELLERCLNEISYIEDIIDPDLAIFYHPECYVHPDPLWCFEEMPPSPIGGDTV